MLIYGLIGFFIFLIVYYLFTFNTMREGLVSSVLPTSFTSDSADKTTAQIDNPTLASISITWFDATKVAKNMFTPTNATALKDSMDPTSTTFDITKLSFIGTGPGSKTSTARVNLSGGSYSITIVDSDTEYTFSEAGGTCKFSTNGCCPDGKTFRQTGTDFCGSKNNNQSSCEFSTYGCCNDGVTTRKTADSSLCTPATNTAYSANAINATYNNNTPMPSSSSSPSSSSPSATYNHNTGDTYAPIYYGEDGATLFIMNSVNTYSLLEKDKAGNNILYMLTNRSPASSFDSVISSLFYAPDGSTAAVTNNNGVYSIKTVHADAKKSTFYYSDTFPRTPSMQSSIFTSNPSSDTCTKNTGYSDVNTSESPQIPFGQNDLYILKTQIVPPVCPMCPSCYSTKDKKTKSKSKSTTSYQKEEEEQSYPRYKKNTYNPNSCPSCDKIDVSSPFTPVVQDFNNTNDSLPMPYMNSFSSF